MKKFLVLLVAIGFVIGMTAGGAVASQLDIAATGAAGPDADVDANPTGPYVVGSEWLAAQAGALNVDLGNAVPGPGLPAADRSDIMYQPTIDIGVNHTITVTITNGAIAPNVDYGLWNLDSLAADKKVADLIDFTADANGYTMMRFKFSVVLLTGETAVFTEDGLVPAAGNTVELRFTNAQLTAGNMTIQVTNAKDDTGVDLTAPLTAAETVAKRIAQLSAKIQHQVGGGDVDGMATSVIDVECAGNARSKFVDEGAGEDTGLGTSQADPLVADANVNNGIVVANATYTLTVNGTQNAFANVRLDGANLVLAAGSWSIDSNFVAHDLTLAAENNLVITVDQTTVIDIATYTVTLVINPDEAGVADVTSLNAVDAFVWTVNAMQAKVSYMALNAAGYLSFLKMVNEGPTAADIAMDAIIWNVTDDVNTVQQNVVLAALPAQSTSTISEADIVAALNLDPAKLYHVALTLTVVAPQNAVHVAGFQKDSIGRTMIPVLYNTNNNNDGRTWQQ